VERPARRALSRRARADGHDRHRRRRQRDRHGHRARAGGARGPGVVAELARLAGRPLLHTAEEEDAMVRACVDAGAVDGLTRRAEPTVDGLPLPAHIGMLELLRTMESGRKTGGPSE
jgi:hypothetical protein